MGEVYLAHDIELNDQLVAVKLLHKNLAQDEQVFQRFRNEVLVARGLVHPNIVRIYDLGKAPEGFYFMTMEYVDGVTLKARLANDTPPEDSADTTRRQLPPLTLEEGIAILTQLLEAAHYAHSRGVIHRDLKPANIVLTRDGIVKLLDFGTARFLEGHANLTQTGQVVGTPLYMSPEQIRGEPIDARSDVYTIGIIAYEVFAGTKPFTAENAMTAMFKHLSEALPPMPSSIPPWLRAVILRATDKTRESRFASAQAFLDALQAKDSRTGLPGTPKATTRSVLPAAILVGVVLLSLCAIVFFAFEKPPAEVEPPPSRPKIIPSATPSSAPSPSPTASVTAVTLPSPAATKSAVVKPSLEETPTLPTDPNAQPSPSPAPSIEPSRAPSVAPSGEPTVATTVTPTVTASLEPTSAPTSSATSSATSIPMLEPTNLPTSPPTSTLPPSRLPPAVTIRAEISVRDAASATPDTSFPLSSLSALRWVAEVRGVNRAQSERVQDDFRLVLSDEDGRIVADAFPVSLLSMGLPGSDSIRVQGSFAKIRSQHLAPGRYRLVLSFRGEKIGSETLELLR